MPAVMKWKWTHRPDIRQHTMDSSQSDDLDKVFSSDFFHSRDDGTSLEWGELYVDDVLVCRRTKHDITE